MFLDLEIMDMVSFKYWFSVCFYMYFFLFQNFVLVKSVFIVDGVVYKFEGIFLFVVFYFGIL